MTLRARAAAPTPIRSDPVTPRRAAPAVTMPPPVAPTSSRVAGDHVSCRMSGRTSGRLPGCCRPGTSPACWCGSRWFSTSWTPGIRRTAATTSSISPARIGPLRASRPCCAETWIAPGWDDQRPSSVWARSSSLRSAGGPAPIQRRARLPAVAVTPRVRLDRSRAALPPNSRLSRLQWAARSRTCALRRRPAEGSRKYIPAAPRPMAPIHRFVGSMVPPVGSNGVRALEALSSFRNASVVPVAEPARGPRNAACGSVLAAPCCPSATTSRAGARPWSRSR